MANLSKIKRDKMIDFLNQLRELHKTNDEILIALGEIQNEINSKKYGLVWEEHEENVDEMIKNNVPVFSEDYTKEIVLYPGHDYNFLLEGDNLHSLYLLKKTHKENIDFIYIDPPYNTGNKDFKYNDEFVDNSDFYIHSKWLSFMKRRLEIAYDLLKENGVIFISINDVEQSQLKLLCDEIFGEESFINNLSVEMSPSSGVKRSHRDKGFIKNKESILVYSKGRLSINPLYDEWSTYDNHYSIYFDGNNYTSLLKVLKEVFPNYVGLNSKMYLFYDDVYQYIVENSDSIWRTHDASKWALRNVELGEKLFSNSDIDIIKVINPGNPEEFEILKSKNKKTGYDRLEPLSWNVAENKIVTLRGDLWLDFDKDMGNVSKEGDIKFPNGKKPIRLLKDLIKCCTTKNSIILDFFAGSGSTGHAVLDLNREDNSERRFILCTNNENGICENVTYKRLSNVINGYKNVDGIKSNLKYYRTDFVSKDEEFLSDELLEHVKEMIQLEHGIKVDGKNYLIIQDEEQADEVERDWGKYTELKGIYISRNVLLSTSQNEKFSNVEMFIIPDYYFDFELKEVGETW